jgi:hypothetical protein
MYHFHQGGHMIGRRVWKDSMAEVEDVAGPTSNTIKNSLNLLLDQIHGGK